MVAPSSPLSFSQVAARGRGTLYVRSTLKTGARSLSFATSNNNTTAGGLSVGSPVRAVASPHLIAIVGGAVCAAVALAVVLAVVHVLRVKRKVEHFGRLINVLGPELIMPMPMPMSTLRLPNEVASIVPVAALHVSPSTRVPPRAGPVLPRCHRRTTSATHSFRTLQLSPRLSGLPEDTHFPQANIIFHSNVMLDVMFHITDSSVINRFILC